MKPLWAVAGVALLSAAGVAGALVIASPGGEEEFVQQAETGTPTASVAATSAPTADETPTASPPCDPNRTSAPGAKLWRWGDLTVSIPEGSEVLAAGGTAQDGEIVVVLNLTSAPDKGLVVSAETGAVLTDQSAEQRAVIDPVLATVSVCPFDPKVAPWPYTSKVPEGARLTYGKLSYLEPDPATGIEVSGGLACAGSTRNSGCHRFLGVRSASSSMYIDWESGAVIEPADIAPEEQEAFDRYLASVQVVAQ